MKQPRAYRSIAVVAAAAASTLSPRLYASIGAGWVNVPITSAAIASDPALNNMQTWSLQVSYSGGDWTEAGMRVMLPAGNAFYQHQFGGNTKPNPSLVVLFPSLSYDSYVSGPGDQGTGNGAPAIFGGFPTDPSSFGGWGDAIPGTLGVYWGDTIITPPVAKFEAARLTFPSSISLASVIVDGSSFVRQVGHTALIPQVGTPPPPPAPPPTRQWAVDADGSWHDPANWSPVGLPANGESVAIDVGGSGSIRTITHNSTGITSVDRITTHERQQAQDRRDAAEEDEKAGNRDRTRAPRKPGRIERNDRARVSPANGLYEISTRTS